jgi:hypothetical protein
MNFGIYLISICPLSGITLCFFSIIVLLLTYWIEISFNKLKKLKKFSNNVYKYYNNYTLSLHGFL